MSSPRDSGWGAERRAPTMAVPPLNSSSGTKPAFSSNTSLSPVARPIRASTKAVPRVMATIDPTTLAACRFLLSRIVMRHSLSAMYHIG